MIKPEQIPIVSMNFYFKSLYEGKSHEECVAAAINAWPDAEQILRSEDEQTYSVILNITQEKNND